MINISKMINDKNVKRNLPTLFYKTEQISTVYTLTKTVRSKIFNRKGFIKTLDAKHILDNMNNLPCNCTTSPFTDPNHGHIVSGDIRIEIALQNFLLIGEQKGNPCQMLYALDKHSHGNVNKNKIKSKNKFSKVKQVLRDPEVVSFLKFLQEQYVMCPIDKAANNISFICKKYYFQILLKELGLLNTASNTYQQLNDTLHSIFQQQNNTLDSVLRLKNNDKEFNCLPCIYWLPKCIKQHLVQGL